MRLASTPAGLAVLAAALLALCRPPTVEAYVGVWIGQNFTGAKFGSDSQAMPPDADGAVGPRHYVELVNGRFSVFNKSNGSKVLTMDDLTFWKNAGIPLGSLGVTDPRVVFDVLSQRWFASMADISNGTSTSNRFLLAISATDSPVGKWNGLAFSSDPTGHNFGDFPTLGLDANGVYLGADLFDKNGTSVGTTLMAIPKSGLLAIPPTAANRTSFGVLSQSTRGSIFQPAVSVGVSTGDEVVIAVGSLGVDFAAHSNLVSSVVQNAAGPGKPTLSAAKSIKIPRYTVPINPTQPGGVDTLDDGDARISSIVYRVGDILYAVHAVQLNNRAALQWFRINALTSALIESGTIADDQLEFFYPSIAANPAGTVVIGFNGTGTNSFIGSYVVVGETLNGTLTFGSPILLKQGSGSYENLDGTGTSRWGDYSATSLDPVDPNRFWTIQTYPASDTAWATQITEIVTVPLALSVAASGPDLLLSWPEAATGYQLESASDLLPGTTWTLVGASPASTNGVLTVSVPASESQSFFRLAKP